MALWTGLGQAATVAQLVGADVGGLVSMIVQAAMTARQNKSECEQLARRVLMIAQLLPHVQEPEAVQPLAGLGDTLRDAHELVVSCQEFTEIPAEVLPHGMQELTLAEIMAATNNFAPDTVIGEGGSGKVYRGRLYNGQEVAIKRRNRQSHYSVNEFLRELDILSLLRHKHIIRLFGSCVTVSKDKRLLTTPQKKIKDLLSNRRRKKPETLIVYEYMENGTLSDHLHRDVGASASSPVTMSWKMRVQVLLAVSRAIEHLHCHANPPIIHRDVKASNILFDASWVSCLSDFGLSVVWDMASEESGLELPVEGTYGYADPEYVHTGLLKPASDVYSVGVVMLEVLTGKRAVFHAEEEMNGDLVSFALPIIEVGNIEELLDRRPLPEPTPWQLHALKRVVQIARWCVRLAGKDRPAISDIVANLEMAYELFCRDESGPVDEPCLWPFLKNDEDSPDSPHASSVTSTCYYSDLEPEVLEDGP